MKATICNAPHEKQVLVYIKRKPISWNEKEQGYG